MTGQNRETASEKKNGHKPQTAPVLESVNEFAAVTEIPNALLGLDSGNIQSQATTLKDPRLHSVQRQTMATQIGQLHGNQHLQRVIQSKVYASKIHNSESNQSSQEAQATDYAELEGIGVGGSLSFVGGNPPASNSQSFVPLIQREDDDDDGDRPSEEERARALALARAAEQVAGQKKGEGHADTAKAKDQGEVQADAAKTAKGQAQQISTEANSIKEKRHATVKAHQEAHAAALNAAIKGATAEVEGEDAGKGAEVEKKAPASPQEDPAFQAVVTRTKKTATHQRHHAPAITKSAEAQAASVPPANDLTSKAQANQVGAMDQAPTPGFNAQAFKAQLMERIAAMAPKTTEEADEFKEKDKLGSIKGEMQGKVSQEKTTSQSPLQDKTKAPPDPSGIEPKQVTELPPADPGAAPGGISAQDAAPKPKTHFEVEKPFQEGSQSLDKQMADEDVTEEQLSNSNEPEFQGALASKKEAQTQAAQAPQEYRSYEGEQVNQAKAQAVGTAQGHLQSMHGDRAQVLTQIAGQQTGAKSQDEAARAKVASDIQKIYDRTKSKVETILSRLDTDVAAAFDAGSQAANQTFEDYVASKMEAYKEDRYGGWFGWARWLKDKVKGMPAAVNVFYSDGRNLFLKEMDAVITNVAEIIARGLNEAKAEVANGKKEIETYVAQLPTNLKEVGDKAASDIQDKFDSLESKIDAKQNELIEQLAVKYNEKLKAVDARIEELKAANQGLIDKAVNFVKGVIRTIKKLKDMIVNVLSRIADVVMGIIKDPIGFLGNLIDGIKSGLDNFISNLPKHLLNALLGWLTGELGPMGIQLPDDIFSLEGIFSLVMQLLGLTWDAIRAKAVKLLGEPVVKTLETGFEIFKILMTEGPIGLWKYVKDMFGNIKEMVIDAIMDMIQTEVIQAGIKWILGLLTPAGAFIKAAMAIYDIVKFFIDKASQIADLIDAIIDSIAAIASGGINAAAKLIENALAKTLPIVIGFLASLLGISDVSKKVQGIIEKIRAKIDKAIDWVIMKAQAAAGKVAGALGFGEKEKEKEEDKVAKPNAQSEDLPAISEPFKAQDGSQHKLSIPEGEGKELILSSRPLSYTQYVDSLATKDDPKKAAAKTAAIQIVSEFYEIRNRQYPEGINETERMQRLKDKRVELERKLAQLWEQTTILLGEQGDIPTGEQNDPIPITWYKPLHNRNLYPPIQMLGNEGEKIQFDIYMGKQSFIHPHQPGLEITLGIDRREYEVRKDMTFIRLQKSERGTKADQFRHVLQLFGADLGGLDADHVLDLNFGGEDEFANIWLLDSGANRSAGSRQNRQIVTYRDRASNQVRAVEAGHPMLIGKFFRIEKIEI